MWYSSCAIIVVNIRRLSQTIHLTMVQNLPIRLRPDASSTFSSSVTHVASKSISLVLDGAKTVIGIPVSDVSMN